MIDLYSWAAPNGHKVQILVEELEIPYRVIPINITAGDQHTDAYRAINPNGKIPAIVDHAPADGGGPFTVFETGAIMVYLAEKEKRFLPTEPRQRSEVLQWLFWQVGGIGPMMGQAQHFFRYASEKVPYAITRYQTETRRLLKILDDRLDGREFICGEYSIADMASFAWIRIHKMTGVPLDEFPRVQDWYGRVRSRPGVGRGLDLLRNEWVDVTKSDEAKLNLFQKNR
ncbi:MULTISPECIES: glutathione S-transferase family protein [unclassified Delftia]|uniref:glutathione S-transferase family protein n=1 Tax=unclassified Delftia TaxID=2613839 RepID=UPI001900DD9C|nr:MULTISPECIES: glutathione S-transferase N-terminal domain-containing protein [unclassified Delftia]MBK0112658.1 glutathione S-transferase N-terminal domain-containing protein [Delftia sp. S65]MBK0119134.1 glutathione S-transferase N-terminal domain-containing protein [Delftia sp. S67]MBK0130393.1 glutathione S-transferase N-terminal domain-containing protein [Delftia sp. S66]